MTGHPAPHALRPRGGLGAAAVALSLVLSAGCSGPQPEEPFYDGPPDAVTAIPADQLPSLAAQLKSAGRTVYYLGRAAHGLTLNSFADFTDDGAGFVASYGPCDPGHDGGCAEPVMVSTERWEAEPAGFGCRPLAPQLSVPTLLVSGEVTLYTGRHVVRILDELDGDPDNRVGAEHALALVPQLRELGATRPARRLPPPDPDVVAWIAQTCPQPSPSAG